MSLYYIVELEEQKYFGTDEAVAKKYIETLEDHIKYVREAGKSMGVDEDQLTTHDDSKWTKDEFSGYAMHFQGGGAPNEFAKSWLHHIHCNPHHWQYWIFPDNYTPRDSNVENGMVEMPPNFTLEMVADWMGAARAYNGRWDMSNWLQKNAPKIRVHSKTNEHLRVILHDLGYGIINFGNNQ